MDVTASRFYGRQILKVSMNYMAAPGIKNFPKFHTADMIIEKVAKYHGVNVESLMSKSRRREYALPRQLSLYYLRKFTKLTLKQAGIKMGGRDHTTTIHSIKTIKDLIDTDPLVKNEVELFCNYFKG